MKDKIEEYNETIKAAYEKLGINHPALCPQLVPAQDVKGNAYNPNVVAPPEMRLLELSIKKDGVTMPVVVVKEDGKHTVIDGFHRTTLCKSNKEISQSLQGYIPVVILERSIEDRMASTVRHNMARGSHQVELSAKLVTTLKKYNWSNERIGKELGMDADEVLRLKQITGLAEAFADSDFSKAWVVERKEDTAQHG